MQAYAGFLSRNGGHDEALKLYGEFDKQLPRYPLVVEAMTSLRKDEQLPRLVDTAQAGAAEALYGLGAALGRREEELSLANRGLAYLQLALVPRAEPAACDARPRRPLRGDEEAASSRSRRMTGCRPSPALKRNAEIQIGIDLDALIAPTKPRSISTS